MQKLALLCLLAVPSLAPAEGPPTPSPTPSPRSLADYASRVRLEPAPGPAGHVVISDATLKTFAGGGFLTTSTGPVRDALPTPAAVDARVKRRWQQAHAAQRRTLERLERRRAGLLAELDRVRDLSPTARTLAKEDALREALAELGREIRGARDELARIVRAARAEGAEPGWFRGTPRP